VLGRLILLFITIPLIELYLLLQMGRYVGAGPTIGLVILTGVAGAYLARSQGLAVLRRISKTLSEGEVPGNHIVDGLLILVGGALLLTPGLLTDLVGFLLIIPASRIVVREWLKVKLRGYVEGRIVYIRRKP